MTDNGSILIRGQAFTNLVVDTRRAERTLGGHRLYLGVRGRVTESAVPLSGVVTLVGDVRGGDRRGNLQVLTRVTVPVGLRSQPGEIIEFELPMDLRSEQLAHLEEARGTDPLVLALDLRGRIRAGEGPNAGHEDVILRSQHETSRDTWFDVLRATGFLDVFLVEVPFPVELTEEWRRAKEALANAQRAVFDGRWAAAVSDARHAIEATQHIVDDRRNLNHLAPHQRTLDKGGRLALLRAAALTFTHPAHHEDENAVGVSESYDRNDALGIVAVATTLVRWAALGR